MAVKRMFATAIMQSTRFLRLSAEARCLYIGINMLADDEGVSEAYVAMLTQRVSDSALSELVDKGFIITLDPEELVVYVKDWSEHNQLRPDRITPSIYHALLDRVLGGDKPEAEKAPSDADSSTCPQLDGNPPTVDGEMSADCQQTAADCQQTAADCQQIAADCPRSIVEGSIGEYSTDYVSIGGGESESMRPEARQSRLRVVPTPEEVRQYVSGKGYTMSADKFYAYHARSGWSRITDWRAAADYWESNESRYRAGKPYIDYTDTSFMHREEREAFDAEMLAFFEKEAVVNG